MYILGNRTIQKERVFHVAACKTTEKEYQKFFKRKATCLHRKGSQAINNN